MARRSPLLIGALIAAAVVVSVDVAVVLRPRHHAATPASPPPEDPEPVVAASPPSPPPGTIFSPTARPLIAARRPPPSPPPPEPIPEPAPEPLRVASERPVDPIARTPAPTSSLQWRAQAIADRNLRVIKAADEKTFEGLSLPEDTRAAIRRINEDYLHRKGEPPVAVDQAVPPPGAAQATSTATAGQPDLERQAALEQLLGVDGAKTFHDAEHTNALRIRPDNGRPWFHQSQQP